jgi:hypothetical protein
MGVKKGLTLNIHLWYNITEQSHNLGRYESVDTHTSPARTRTFL